MMRRDLRLMRACMAMTSALVLAGNVAVAQSIAGSGDLAALKRAASQSVVPVSAAAGPTSFADLAETVLPAVIGVRTKVAGPKGDRHPEGAPCGGHFRFGTPESEKEQSDDPESAQTTTEGSGFFISADGYAVTNGHVVQNSDTVEIQIGDKETYTAKVVGRDSISDLALIKVDGRSDFSFVRLAEQPPRVGDWVLAVGNPFGLGGTVTAGIVSARERNIEQGSAEDLLQIDAPINSGDSGGPSFDTKGNVVGVNSMILSPSGGSVGIAFAVPAETIRTVIPQLKEKGSVTRGWIGVEIQTVTPEIAEAAGLDSARGAIVAGITHGSPAEESGIANGDVIASLDGNPIKDANELIRKVHAMPPDTSTELGVIRNGKHHAIKLTLGQLPSQTGDDVERN